ncbi:MAG: UvrD-helicase domain-containing protein [Muribaculaceae bacterium]|nr:UvrD-helicase domain-containing protein [Muribaculaceae bacterium]
MLKIQKASAGSGKTYTLAKNFILNLIAFKNINEKWQLRNARQIEEGLQHILAITFTNKATNEMKQRIVNNLSKLAKASTIININEEFLKNTPYLKEFQEILDVSYQEIGKACETALKTVLNNYTLFRISTIDSFFQEILRTFTYEANLNDSYQLEIDSSFVTDSAIDASIQELDSYPKKMGNAYFWMKTIMQKEAKTTRLWNPFNNKNAKKSVYNKIKDTLLKLEKEDFKGIKQQLDNYFNIPGNTESLKTLYEDFQNAVKNERETLLELIKKAAEDLNKIINNDASLEKKISRYQTVIEHINISLGLELNDKFDRRYESYLKNGSILKKEYIGKYPVLDAKAMELYGLLNQWKTPDAESYYKNWIVYGELLPYFGLLLEVRAFLSKILENNNLIQLSDTSYILKKIIGEDDAPFIYERLGNKIEHYLIDEFQDTSKMQWDVIFPLLKESDSTGQDSLIIGDPKQSIYRFRNANHKLITEEVPRLFQDHISAGHSIEENTNWRSHTLVVAFNNYFFKVLATILTEISLNKGLSTDFNYLYSNVVQKPGNNKGRGYVEVKMLSKPTYSEEKACDDEDDNNEEKKDWYEEGVLTQVGPLISSLIERGYYQKEIAVLVNTNETGKKVIQALIDYNGSLTEGKPRINFISEESLLVSSSSAVGIVIGVLEKLANPGSFYKPDEKEEEIEDSKRQKRYVKWNQIRIDYEIYSNKHMDLAPLERILSFLEEKSDGTFQELIKGLTTPSLAALVETIISLFLDNSLKNSEALYLSSLQDLVNDYSVNHSNDPASFLEWWKSRGRRMSVSTPEGSNAVQIMTIHKSKGLEFKCVIIPFATESFLPSSNKEEWRWVDPLKLKGLNLPPKLPVKTVASLMGSSHESVYREYIDQILTDNINMWYVAFTRARNELYLFTKSAQKGAYSLSNFIKQILIDNTETYDFFPEEESRFIISTSQIEFSEEEGIIKVGEPFTKDEIITEHIKEKKELSESIHYFEDYFINETRPQLRSLATKVSPSGEFGSIPAIN